MAPEEISANIIRSVLEKIQKEKFYTKPGNLIIYKIGTNNRSAEDYLLEAKTIYVLRDWGAVEIGERNDFLSEEEGKKIEFYLLPLEPKFSEVCRKFQIGESQWRPWIIGKIRFNPDNGWFGVTGGKSGHLRTDKKPYKALKTIMMSQRGGGSGSSPDELWEAVFGKKKKVGKLDLPKLDTELSNLRKSMGITGRGLIGRENKIYRIKT